MSGQTTVFFGGREYTRHEVEQTFSGQVRAALLAELDNQERAAAAQARLRSTSGSASPKARTADRDEVRRLEAEAKKEEAAARRAEAEARKAEAPARNAERKAEIASQQAAKKARGGGLAPVPRGLGATSIFPESGEVRLLDAAVAAGVGALGATWTATRKTVGAEYGYGAALMGIGALGAVMGRGEVRAAGYGLLGSEAAYLTLRTILPDLAKPAAGAALVEPAGIVRIGYAVVA